MNRVCSYQNGVINCGNCLKGYIRENDICVALSCQNTNPCENLLYLEETTNSSLTCNDILTSHPVCLIDYLNDSNTNEGLLICSEDNLNGFCHFTNIGVSSTTSWIESYIDRERIISSFKLDKDLDTCICNSPYYPVCTCYSANNQSIIKNDINIYAPYIKVTPSNYEKFKEIYPNKKYIKFYSQDEKIFELITESYINDIYYLDDEHRIINKFNLKKITFESIYKLIFVDFDGAEITFDPWADINETNPNPDDYIFEIPNSIDLNNFSYIKLVNRESNENNNEGVYLCNNRNNCYNINNHITTTDDVFNPESSNCSKSEIYIPGDDICINMSEFKANLFNDSLYYLNDGWEVFWCDKEEDDIKDCHYQGIAGWHHTISFEKAIIQPKLNTDIFNEFYQNKEYVVVYDEPNYNGNHIIYSSNGLQNNSILRVRSIETSSKNIRAYLNIDSVNKKNNYNNNNYNNKNDRYLTDTDSTSFIFDEQTIEATNNHSYYHVDSNGFAIPNETNKKKFGYKSIRLDIKTNNKFKTYDVENGGIEISHVNGNSCSSLYDVNVYACDNKTQRLYRKLCYGYNDEICDKGYTCQSNGNSWYCRKETYCTEYTNFYGQDDTCPKGYICNLSRNTCEAGCLNNTQCDYNQYCDLSNGENFYYQEYCSGNNCKKGVCRDYPARHFYSTVRKGDELMFPEACNEGRNGNHWDYCNYDALSPSIKIKINDGWEAYYCPIDMMAQENPDIIREECIYLDENTQTTSAELELNNNWLNYYYQLGVIFINPKNYDKFIQYYGHSEYNEKGKGEKGYIELFTKTNFKGRREVIWNDDYDLSDNLIPGNKIKSIKIVGNINPEFVNNLNKNIYLDRNDYYLNENKFKKINIKNHNKPFKPTFKAIRSNDTPTPEYAWGFFDNYPYGENGITREYFYPGDNEVIPDLIYENKKQAETFDGADLILQDSHGSWTSHQGSNPSYTGSFGMEFFNPLRGGSLGDSDLEWFLTGSCQSLGSIGTSDQEAIWGYRELFANGLHGVGGFYRNSFWSDGPFYNMGMRFWISLIYNKLPLGKTWVALMYKDDPKRNAGFISAGNCNNYMHKDYWFGIKTGPKKDPSKKYLKEHGFCYYSHANGNRNYSISDIIGANATAHSLNQSDPRPKENWPVFNETENNLNENVAEIISDYDNININFDKKLDNLYYFKDSSNNIEIQIDSNNFNPDIPEKQLDSNLIFELYSKAYNIIEIINEKKFVNDLFLGDINLYYGLEQEFSYEGHRTKAMINEILFTFYFHSGTGYFLESNSITIGFDPVTYKITTVKSSIRNLIKTNEYINGKKILKDLKNFRNNDKINTYKVKYVKQKNKYKPAIIKYDLTTHIVSPIKIY